MIPTPLRADASHGAPPSLEGLLAAAVRLRPDSPALGDDTGEQRTFAQLEAAVAAFADRAAAVGLRPGERVLVQNGARSGVVIALLGAARAGLEIVLAPLDLGPPLIAQAARKAGAAALIGVAAYGPLAPIEGLFEAAADAECVRLVGSIGRAAVDGAVDFSVDGGRGARPAGTQAMRIFTLARGGEGVELIAHDPALLIAEALGFVAQAGLGMMTPIVSTLAPVTRAGLVLGPLAALALGADLRLHGPFEADTFIALVGSRHVVAPAALAPLLQRAGLLEGPALAALVMLSRDRPAPHVRARGTVFDVLASGERSVTLRAKLEPARLSPG